MAGWRTECLVLRLFFKGGGVLWNWLGFFAGGRFLGGGWMGCLRDRRGICWRLCLFFIFLLFCAMVSLPWPPPSPFICLPCVLTTGLSAVALQFTVFGGLPRRWRAADKWHSAGRWLGFQVLLGVVGDGCTIDRYHRLFSFISLWN